MGQVPKYTILGGGRLAKHLADYFSHEELKFHSWTRTMGPDALAHSLADSDFALLAVSDSAIESVWKNISRLRKPAIHFSGALTVSGIQGFHPLMTFAHGTYDPDFYKTIPFVCERGSLKFSDVFPSLKNPSHEISPEKKALYHALCVMSGNFTTLLWEKFFKDLEHDLQIPRSAAIPYLRKTSENLQLESSPLTGPLQRNDQTTIQKNLDSLVGDPYRNVYVSFVNAFKESSL